MRSAVTSRSGSMSWRAISADRRAGEDRMSPSKFFVNTTLPAPIRTIRGTHSSATVVIRTYGRPDVNVAGRDAARNPFEQCPGPLLRP
jgi:hypothetical protein